MANEFTLIVVTTTVDTKDKANFIASSLVKSNLAACAQVFPVHSHYTWQNDLHEEMEWLIQVKTIQNLFPMIEVWIQKHHPYDTPELIALPIVAVSTSYKQWVEAQCL